MGNPISRTGVFVNLLNGVGHFGDAEGDVYKSIENVVGSEFDDILQDSDGDNTLRGEGGNDVLFSTTGILVTSRSKQAAKKMNLSRKMLVPK